MSNQEARFRQLLGEVFTTEAAIDEWLDTPDKMLGWLAPRTLIESDPDQVEARIFRMIHGLPPQAP